MPHRFAIKSLLFLCMSVGGYFAYSMQTTNLAPEMLKNLDLSPSHEILLRTQKILPPFKVEFATDNLNIKPGEAFELTAVVTVEKKNSQIEYEWLLPPNVKFMSAPANISGELYNLSPHVETKISAWFVTDSEVNEKIHIRVATENNKKQSAQTAQFNTLEQAAIDEARQNLAESQNQYLLEHPELLKRNE